MRMALDEAHLAYEAGEIPIGAVVVCKDRVISRAHNLTETGRRDSHRSCCGLQGSRHLTRPQPDGDALRCHSPRRNAGHHIGCQHFRRKISD